MGSGHRDTFSAEPRLPGYVTRQAGVSHAFARVVQGFLAKLPETLQEGIAETHLSIVLCPTFMASLPFYKRPMEVIRNVWMRQKYGPVQTWGTYYSQKNQIVFPERKATLKIMTPDERLNQWANTLFHEMGHFVAEYYTHESLEKRGDFLAAFTADEQAIRAMDVDEQYPTFLEPLAYYLNPGESFAEVFSTFYANSPESRVFAELFPRVRAWMQEAIPELLPPQESSSINTASPA